MFMIFRCFEDIIIRIRKYFLVDHDTYIKRKMEMQTPLPRIQNDKPFLKVRSVYKDETYQPTSFYSTQGICQV